MSEGKGKKQDEEGSRGSKRRRSGAAGGGDDDNVAEVEEDGSGVGDHADRGGGGRIGRGGGSNGGRDRGKRGGQGKSGCGGEGGGGGGGGGGDNSGSGNVDGGTESDSEIENPLPSPRASTPPLPPIDKPMMEHYKIVKFSNPAHTGVVAGQSAMCTLPNSGPRGTSRGATVANQELEDLKVSVGQANTPDGTAAAASPRGDVGRRHDIEVVQGTFRSNLPKDTTLDHDIFAGQKSTDILTTLQKIRDEMDVDAAKVLKDKLVADGNRFTIAVYNNKGGVLKSTMTSELAFMFADLGINVLLVDLDSQCSLTENLLELDSPESDIRVTSRVQFPLVGPRGNPTERAVPGTRYSIYEGLPWMADPLAGTADPEQVQPILLRHSGPRPEVQFDRAAGDKKRPEATADKIQRVLNESRAKDVGSVHLILGHHDSGSISEALSFSRLSNDASKRKYHSGVNWLIKRAMEKVDAQIALVDLNPDTSALNRTVIMQSDSILIPCWPDKDGVKCMVDLKSRIVAGLDIPPSESPFMNIHDYKSKNADAWAQIHMDLIEKTKPLTHINNSASSLAVPHTFPKMLGVLMNTKQPFHDLTVGVQVSRIACQCTSVCSCEIPRAEGEAAMAQKIIRKYERMVKVLSEVPPPTHTGRTATGVFSVVDEQNQRKTVASKPPLPPMGDQRFETCHGGIWKTDHLMLRAAELRKPISQMTKTDLAGKTRTAEFLKSLVQYRHRVHMIARSVLSNVAIQCDGGGSVGGGGIVGGGGGGSSSAGAAGGGSRSRDGSTGGGTPKAGDPFDEHQADAATTIGTSSLAANRRGDCVVGGEGGSGMGSRSSSRSHRNPH